MKLIATINVFLSIIYLVSSQRCHNLKPECPAWHIYCANNDWVRDQCPLTCKQCQPFNQQFDEPPPPAFDESVENPNCEDTDENCRDWVSSSASLCATTEYVKQNCRKSCSGCNRVSREYDIGRLPRALQSIGFLLGKWRSEHGGKVRFPTIPVFTFGEQIEFRIADLPSSDLAALNFSSTAWGINEQFDLHSEYGFLAMRDGTSDLALTTVMNNGFTTVEQGYVSNNVLHFRLQDIGRISFSRDLPVHDLIREWRLIDTNTLEARVEMETLTHPMQEHTFIRYKKIFP